MSARPETVPLQERLLRSVHAVAGLDRDGIRVAPFTAYLDDVREAKWFSFAMPDPGAAGEEAAAALPELLAAFRSRGRHGRIEVFDELAPDVPGALLEAGWGFDKRMPVMACTPGSLRHPDLADGVALERLRGDEPDALLREFQVLQRAMFDDDEPVTDEQVERMRRRAPTSVFVAARHEGALVATAAATSVQLGVVEVGGVVTAHHMRRRGLAGATTAAVCAQAFSAGADIAWLTAADDAAARIYTRAGFAPAGSVSAYDAPAG